MLLAVGLYAPVLAAVSDFDWPILATLAAGCATGLLLFSRLLTWVLARFRHQVLGLLTGFMLGALANLWPWRLEGDWLSPQGFALAGGDPLVVGCLIAVVLGVGALLALVRLDR